MDRTKSGIVSEHMVMISAISWLLLTNWSFYPARLLSIYSLFLVGCNSEVLWHDGSFLVFFFVEGSVLVSAWVFE